MDPSGRISRIVGVPRLIDPPTSTTQSVSVEVVRVLGPGRFLINYGGRSATAFSSLDLQPGQVLKAHLSQDTQGLVIRVPTESQGDALSAVLRELAVPDDAVSRRVVEALLRTGLGLNPDRIVHLRRLFKAYGESGRLRGLMRLAALLEDKGLDPSLSEALFEPVYGSSEQDESGSHDSSKDDGGEQSGRSGASEGRTTPVNHDQVVEHVSQQLRALLGPGGGLTVQENSGRSQSPERPEADLLRLFNHVAGKNAHWVVVPFLLRRGDVGELGEAGKAGKAGESTAQDSIPKELAGRIRLRFDMTRVSVAESAPKDRSGGGARSGADLVVLDVEGAKGRWWCEIRPERGEEKFRVVLRASSQVAESAARNSLQAFSDRFSAAGISIDKLVQAAEFDGFSSEAAVDIIHDIDTKA